MNTTETAQKIEGETNSVEAKEVEQTNKAEKETETPFYFEASTKKDIIEDFLKPISIFVDEARMDIDERGISIKVIEKTNVCMSYTTLKKEGMSRYKVSDKRTIGMPIKTILKLVSKAKKDEIVSIEYLPQEPMSEEEIEKEAEKEEKAKVKGDGIRITFSNLQYEVALINIDTMQQIPRTIQGVHLPVEVTLRSAKFRETIELVSEIADVITFKTSNHILTAEGTGHEGHNAERQTRISATLEEGDMLKFESENLNEEIKVGFNLEYLDKISKAIAKTEKVCLRLNTDYPCKIETDFADGKGTINYMLAPYIDDD